MDDLGLEAPVVAGWFAEEENGAHRMVRISEEDAERIRNSLTEALRRCYISDQQIDQRAAEEGVTRSEIIDAVLPDPGPVMAGDFGEALSFLYQAASALPETALGPKKWRLKDDRRQPAPYSDVVHFILPDWPEAGENDVVRCAEVKTKSTDGASSPIAEAVSDVEKDRTSRLADTLVWLRERVLLGHDLGSVERSHLERFIEAVDYPPASKEFFAVAVICTSLVDEEMDEVPDESPEHCTLVIISVPALRELYSELYDSASRPGDGGSGTRAGSAEPE